MTDSHNSIWHGFRRHRLFPIATVYAVAGWVLIQFADILLEAFESPPWIMQGLLLVVLIGFPITLICVWLLDRSRKDSPSHQSSALLTIGLAVVISAVTAFWLYSEEADDALDSEPGIAGVRQSNPVLAVLPFTNMSSSTENEFVADGLTEDIITLLAQSPGMEVIARNSTFKYKNQNPDIRDVGRDLGADYVVEGSIRPLQQRVRVTVQVIDTRSGAHIWAEKYDRPLKEFFDLQDEVSIGVAAAVGDAVFRQEYNAVKQSRTDNLNAWVLTSRADVAFSFNMTDSESLAMARQAAELEPQYALAHATLARQLALISLAYEWPDTEALWPGVAGYRVEAEKEARLSYELAPDDPKVMSFVAIALLWTGHPQEALDIAERVTKISPRYAEGLAYYADILIHNGRSREAVAYFEKAIRLTPNAPQLGFYQLLLGEALMHHGDFTAAEGALIQANRIFQGRNDAALQYLAGTQLRIGKTDAAKQTLETNSDQTGLPIADLIKSGRRTMEFYSSDSGGEHFAAVWRDLSSL